MIARHATPIAVLVGSAIVAWAVWSGLSKLAGAVRDAPQLLASATTVPSTVPVSTPVAPEPATGAPTGQLSPEVLERDLRLHLRDKVREAFARQIARYAEECWKNPPAGARPGEFVATLTFNGQGSEVSRKIEPSGLGLKDEKLLNCVRNLKQPPVNAPVSVGKQVTLEIPFSVP